MGDDDDAVGEGGRLLQVVGGEQDGAAAAGLGAHRLPEGDPGADVHAGGGLVHHEEVGVRQQSKGQAQALALASRAAAHFAGEELSKTCLVDDVVEPGSVRDAVAVPGSHRGHDPQGLPDGEVVQKTAVLEDDTNATCLDRMVGGGSQKLDRPGVGPGQPQDHVEGGGLARAIGTQEGDHLSGPDGQVEVVDGDEAAECLAQATGVNRGGWSRAPDLRTGPRGVSGGGCGGSDHGPRLAPPHGSRY